MHEHTGTEPVLPPSGEGTVVLDIGGDIGAAIIYTDSVLNGSEIEIRPQGQPWQGMHTGIRERELQGNVSFAAVFGSIAAGTYQLRLKGTGLEPVMEIEIVGADVTQVDWPVE
jgi:hypothetical protein